MGGRGVSILVLVVGGGGGVKDLWCLKTLKKKKRVDFKKWLCRPVDSDLSNLNVFNLWLLCWVP